MDSSTIPSASPGAVARSLALLEGPRATLVVRELLRGPPRSTEIRTRLPGISARTPTRRLRRFALHGTGNGRKPAGGGRPGVVGDA